MRHEIIWVWLLDEQYTRMPYHRVRRMTTWLRNQDYRVNHKHVARLLRTMGLEMIYPKPYTRQPHSNDMLITRVYHVWSTGVTYSAPS